MAALTTFADVIRGRFANTHIGAVSQEDMLTVVTHYGKRLAVQVNNTNDLGPDFQIGSGSVYGFPDHTFDEYNSAIERYGSYELDRLCGNVGITNIGVYGKKFVVKHKWLVSLFPHSLRSHMLTTAHNRLSFLQGLELSAHNSIDDTATVLNITDMAVEDRFFATIDDIMMFVVNCSAVLQIDSSIIQSWGIFTLRTNPALAFGLPYPAAVPVGSVKWFLSEQQEAEIAERGYFERLDVEALSDVVSMHDMVSYHIHNVPTSPVYVPTTPPNSPNPTSSMGEVSA